MRLGGSGGPVVTAPARVISPSARAAWPGLPGSMIGGVLVCCRSTALSYHAPSRKSTYISLVYLVESVNITTVNQFVTTPLTNPQIRGMLSHGRTDVLSLRPAGEEKVFFFAPFVIQSLVATSQPCRFRVTFGGGIALYACLCSTFAICHLPFVICHLTFHCATFSFTPASLAAPPFAAHHAPHLPFDV